MFEDRRHLVFAPTSLARHSLLAWSAVRTIDVQIEKPNDHGSVSETSLRDMLVESVWKPVLLCGKADA